MARGVTFIPTAIKVTPWMVQRHLETFERVLFSSGGASMIGVEDTGGHFTATDLEGVLAELWADATSASSDTFTDTFNYYPVDQVGAAFDALGQQIGGTDATSYTFTENNVLANDDPVYTALNKLDEEWGDLSDTAVGHGAAMVGLNDAGGYYTAGDVEAALQELGASTGAAIIGINDAGGYYGVETDVEGALQLLGSTNGAAVVGITDTGGYYTATDIEAALQELGASTGAAIIGLADSGGYYVATDVEAALQELGASTGAAIIGLADGGGYYIATDVEAALQELGASTGAAIIGITDGGGYYTGTDVEAALQELGFTTGAGIIGVADAGGYTTAANVEDYLQEIDPGAWFKSTGNTGTGAPQNIAHGLGRVPRMVMVIPTAGDDGIGGAGTNMPTITEGAHDATNVIVTCTAGATFTVVAV